MAATRSTMLALGTEAPAFSLPDPDGKLWSLGDFAATPGLLVAVLSNHCPFVKHVADGLGALAARDARSCRARPGPAGAGAGHRAPR